MDRPTLSHSSSPVVPLRLNLREDLTLRRAGRPDNPVLFDIIRSAPMRGDVAIYLDRSPDFFTLTDIREGRARISIAEHDKKPVGAMVEMVNDYFFRGRPVRVLNTGDMRVTSAKHGAGIGALMIAHAKARLVSGEVDLGMVEMMRGNDGVRRLAEKVLHPDVRITSGGYYGVYQILPFHLWPGFSGSRLIRQARQSDLPAIAALMRDYYKDYCGIPDFSQAWLEQLLSRHPSISLENLRVVERRGEITACAAVWDQTAFRRPVLVDQTRKYRWVRRLVSMFRMPLGLQPLPGQGESWSVLNLCFMSCRRDREGDLKHLVRTLVKMAGETKNFHFVQVAMHEREPARRCLKGLLRTRVDYEIFYHTRAADPQTPAPVEELGQAIPWIEFAWV